jgi:endonuclease YncB( thermonuclease family)
MNRRFFSLFAAALLFAVPLTAVAAELTGRVVGITDGDSIIVLDADKKQHKIRLAGIDAPELKQAFGTRSKQNLSEMANDKDARLVCHKTIRNERKLCKVWVQPSDCPQCGETLDVGYAQISTGLAWWYRAYAKEQSPEDRGRYESEETDARLRKRGLWADSASVPPWEWRKAKN